MTVADLFSFVYMLTAEEVGGRRELESRIDKFMELLESDEYANSDARFAPDKQLPDSEAESLKAAMALGGMARPRTPDVEDEVRENELRQEAADALGEIIARGKK